MTISRSITAAGLAAALAASATAATPVPTPKPDLVPPAAAVAAPLAVDGAAVAAIRSAISSLDVNDLDGALAAVEGRAEPERDLVAWLAIRRQVSGLEPGSVAAFGRDNPHWPSPSLFVRRIEQAFVRLATPEDVVREFAGRRPVSDEAILALARAQLRLGRAADAGATLGPWWRREPLSPDLERQYDREFGEHLARADHKARYDMLMYADRVDQAGALAARLGSGWAALAQARRAVLRKADDAAGRLDRVSGEARSDPLFAFTLAEFHRLADRNVEAATALSTVKAEAVADHADAWWVERRIVSRALVEAGDAARAYQLAAAHRGGNAETAAEAHFHAGWYALRFLGDPSRARPHFETLRAVVSLPISRARASYWLGRTEEAAGRVEAARKHYTVAAADEATFYGQLARVKLSLPRLDMPPVPEPTAEDALAFRQNELARAVVLLVKAGAMREVGPLVTELGRQLPSGGQVAMLADYLTRIGEHRLALQLGKAAADRDLGTERLAFPLEAIPESGRTQKRVEIAMVYAIARQESAFDTGAVSRAGALGLLQLLPGTAQATARTLGLPYSRPRLTGDADYNATLGAAFLGDLVDRFGGSYVLAFAAYNAGPRRADEWIARFGDPRDPAVDPVDWIEQIPYGETRSYVQRILENLQVYRERLDDEARLSLASDLARGRRQDEAEAAR